MKKELRLKNEVIENQTNELLEKSEVIETLKSELASKSNQIDKEVNNSKKSA